MSGHYRGLRILNQLIEIFTKGECKEIKMKVDDGLIASDCVKVMNNVNEQLTYMQTMAIYGIDYSSSEHVPGNSDSIQAQAGWDKQTFSEEG